MLGCVCCGEFRLGPRSPHGHFFALKRVNLASSPRKDFIEFLHYLYVAMQVISGKFIISDHSVSLCRILPLHLWCHLGLYPFEFETGPEGPELVS